MHFEVVHEFDIPLDALELAVISPNLFQELSKRLHSIESVSQKEHILSAGPPARLDRLWSYRANVKIPSFATKYVTPEMCAWDEKSTYDIKRHASEGLHCENGRGPGPGKIRSRRDRAATDAWHEDHRLR